MIANPTMTRMNGLFMIASFGGDLFLTGQIDAKMITNCRGNHAMA
jgi:hypothetical protein